MTFFKTRAQPKPEAEPPSVAPTGVDPLAVAEGKMACAQKGCPSQTGLRCEYVDRRRRECATAWCPSHRLTIDGQIYCRRHAGLISALNKSSDSPVPPPDLDNRAPSLVCWVAREIDADIRNLLVKGWTSGSAQLLTDNLTLVFVGSDRRRAWERSWKLVDHFGFAVRVALRVEEEQPNQVDAVVGAKTVAHFVPPWIIQHSEPDNAQDKIARSEFNSNLLGAISDGVTEELRFQQMLDESGPQ